MFVRGDGDSICTSANQYSIGCLAVFNLCSNRVCKIGVIDGVFAVCAVVADHESLRSKKVCNELLVFIPGMIASDRYGFTYIQLHKTDLKT